MTIPQTPESEKELIDLPEEQESVTDWGSLDEPQGDLNDDEVLLSSELSGAEQQSQQDADFKAVEPVDDLDSLITLDAVIAEPSATAPADIDDLDALLGESMAVKRSNDAAKAAKERLKRGGMSQAERLETEALIRQWELAHEWKPEANVALFTRQVCHCGVEQTCFNRLMTRMRHRHLAHSAMRWLPAEVAQSVLPNETTIRVVKVPLCGSCAETKGWSMVNPILWKE